MSMDDLELERLLRSADRPRAMSADERARVLAAIAASDDVADDSTDDIAAEHGGRVVAPMERGGGGRHAGRRPASSTWWLSAAAVIVVLGLVIAVAARREPEAPAEPPVGETVPAVPSPWCVERVDPLADALRRWRGVDNWAWAGGIPDVGVLVADALATSGAGPDAEMLAGDLRSDLAEIDERDPSDIDRVIAERRTSAVDAALDELLEVIAEVDSACPIGPIEATR